MTVKSKMERKGSKKAHKICIYDTICHQPKIMQHLEITTLMSTSLPKIIFIYEFVSGRRGKRNKIGKLGGNLINYEGL